MVGKFKVAKKEPQDIIKFTTKRDTLIEIENPL
jgi:hypothetical protein